MTGAPAWRRLPSATARWCVTWSRHAAPPRHAAASARPFSRPRLSGGRAAGRDRAAARRRADPAGSTCPTMRRSTVGAAGAGRPARAHYAGLVNAVLRRVARDGAQHLAGDRHRAARYAGVADGALGEDLRRRPGARHRRRQRPGAGARPHGQGRSRPTGRKRSAGACCRPARCAPWCTGRCRDCRATPKAPGGCRTPPPHCRRGCSATCAAERSPTSAPRPAARPPSSPPPARSVTAVDRAPKRLERLQQNLARLGLTRRDRRRRRHRMAGGPFDAVLLDAPCSSTGTIRRHPDIPWLKRESDIATLAALQRRLLAQRVRAAPGRAARWSTAPARSSRRKASTSCAICWRASSARAPPADRQPARSAAWPIG